MSNYIYAYYQQIADGSVNVSRWVRLWYESLIKNIENGTYKFSKKKSDIAIKFIENFCRHHEGELAPQHIKLELWQKALISVIFGILDEYGNRQFREVFVVLGRKQGKTLLASAISSYMMFLDGEYGGRIYFVAPKLEQAKLCYEAFYQTIKKEPLLDGKAVKRRTDVYVEETNSSAKPLAFSEKKSDGLNCSMVVADELASWGGEKGLKFYEVIKSSMGSRKQPLLLGITTAGYENEGIYDELMKRSTRVLLGDTNETRLAPFIYQIDDAEKWNDINELEKSLPNLSVSVSVDYILEEIAIAETSLSKRAEFLTKYANIKQNSSQAWISTKDLTKVCGDELALGDFKHCYCVAGVDLSQTTDLTSCTILIEKDGELYLFNKMWLPSEKLDEAIERDNLPYNLYIQRGLLSLSGENFVDYSDVYRYLVSMVEEYEILPLMVGYDRYSAQYLIQDLKNYGFQCDDVYQGDNLYPVIQEFEGTLKDGRIHIGDNDLLKVHFFNSAIKYNNERGRGRLVKINPSAHIDGMASTLDAFCVRQKYFNELGERLKNE